ncbi:MAG: peptide-binding protein [Candidatus Omnitrophica bacterium]|nr:peptide-binding protein [Candidatus Omnitrophota bacterium]MDD5352350.1 peptide-binding protein [Candidatus Omnitrophota bacterium]MDD5549948.1 peptide-binding protein [Candidatus Omnitrophota bacterium]
MRLIILFLILTNVFLPITANAEQKDYGDAIIIASIADARTLIPILASDTASSQACSQIFNGLIKYDKNLNIVGDLAEKWEASKDGFSITFYLRKNVCWHDGYPFTAKDVEFTYQKLTDPNTATPYSGDFKMIDKLEIIDDYTVKVTYKEPFSPGLSSWGMSIIPKHILEGKDLNKTDFQRNPVGTGPYRFKKWKAQEKIELIYYDKYFEGRPYISRYINRVIPDEASIFLELQTKAIDYAGLSPIAYKFKTQTKFFQDNFNKFKLPGFGYTYLGYNLKNPLFKDRNVRTALDYAIDKEEIIKMIFFGLAKPITGPFIIDSWAYDNQIKPREFNLEKAKQLLKEAGWQDSDGDQILDKNGIRFEFTITTNQGNDERIKTAEIIQKRLKDIGIKVKIKVLEWSVFLSECVEKRNFDAVLLGWSLSLDPDPFDIWHSSKTKEGEFNFIGYKNEEVDNLIIEGRRTFDQSKRKEIYHKIHKIIFEEQPYMFLYSPESLVIIDRRFQGIDPGPAGIGYNFIKWWVAKEKQRYKNVIQE